MADHPFTGVKIKKYLSGIDASFELETIEDSIIIAGNDIKEIISPEMYNSLCGAAPVQNATEWAKALEHLRYAMAPLAFFHHFIWLQLRISNNSVTTFKTDGETTAFKYQSDEAKENLLLRHGVFIKELIEYLDTNADILEAWKNSDQKKELDGLLIKNYREFDKVYNTGGDAAFFIRSRSLQRDAMDMVSSHVDLDELLKAATPDTSMLRKLKKAVVYLTISKALAEWAEVYLPAPIRSSISSETNTRTNSDEVKKRLSNKYQVLAENELKAVDMAKLVSKEAAEHPNDIININATQVKDNDKFYSSF